MGNIGSPVIIEVKDLVVEYDIGNSQFTAVDISAWSLDKGAQVAIFGPSGCGKSTLLHVLAGLLVPKSGKVNVCGAGPGATERVRPGSLPGQAHRVHLPGLQPASGLYGRGKRAAGNDVFAPKAGPAPRPGIADEGRAFAPRRSTGPPRCPSASGNAWPSRGPLPRKPELILADEPTGSLDPFHAREVVKLLGEACREHGCSLVVVSHDPGVVDAFDSSVAFMELNRAFSTAPAAGGAA